MDSDDEGEISSWKGIPGTVILINAYGPKDITEIALDAINQMLRHYFRTSSTQYVGVCIYGTEDNNSSNFGIRSLMDILPLTQPTLDDYKKIKDADLASLNSSKELILSDALWHSSKMFANCKKQLSSRSVIILSKFDTPPVVVDQKPSFLRVVDLVDSNIDIKLINISDNDYAIDPFYEKFLIEISSHDHPIFPKPLWNSGEIKKLLLQQSHRHLAVARINFEIGNDLAIGVGVYSLLKRYEQVRPKSSTLDEETNTVVTTVTKTMKVSIMNEIMDIDEDISQPQVPIFKSELIHYQEYGGERIEFNDEELKMIRNPFGSPGLKLLGFKPLHILCKEKWFFKPCYFLFPNESLIEGSTTAFKAFHTACAETGVVAICVLCTRVNAKPIIVALSPCTYPLGLDIEIGFDIIPIPFVEHVRDLPIFEDEMNDISQAHKTVMEDVVNLIKFDYKPDMFVNPKLEVQYRTIEAIALEEINSEPFIDTTKPESKAFNSINEELFEELFGPFNEVAPKRLTSSRESGPSMKKVKKENVDEETVFRDRVKNGKLGDYTVTQLKDILKQNCTSKLPALTGKKKSELIDLIYNFCK